MDSYFAIARALAAAFLHGELEEKGMVERGSRVLGRRWRWLRPLARRVMEAFAEERRPRLTVVTVFITHDRGFERAWDLYDIRVQNDELVHAEMHPIEIAKSWGLPEIRTSGELADWFGLTCGELDWFADRRSLEYKRSRGKLRHYNYRALTKRFGQVRLIESPKPRLKYIQRRILHEILEQIPPHQSAHGFRRGRSVMSFAGPHVSKKVVVRIDLHEFFPSIPVDRIQTMFRTVGYPEIVADLLAGLCTNRTPLDVWGDLQDRSWARERFRILKLYSEPHLPQGAPTSPALANLACFRLDARLAGLAKSVGAHYTRYADDLAFSGPTSFDRVVKRFQIHVCVIAMEEGFAVHHRKTRIMRTGCRQQLAGLVVNDHLNIRRSDFDQLKATLTNCVRQGVRDQNRSGLVDFRSHLEGRISFVEHVNPHRGNKLRELFQQISW